MSAWQLMPALLLLVFTLALSAGLGIVVLLLHRAARKDPRAPARPALTPFEVSPPQPLLARPKSWLAIKSRNVGSVQAALALHNPKRCSWAAAVARHEELFIAPPVKGWILVIGSALPDPAEDVDVCYRFLTGLSAKMGEVQYFSASSVVRSHAWFRAERGRVARAYAWAGQTLWQQGRLTPAERELNLRCFDYGEEFEPDFSSQQDIPSQNCDKVPLLASRWSLDPARVNALLQNDTGIAGELSRRF